MDLHRLRIVAIPLFLLWIGAACSSSSTLNDANHPQNQQSVTRALRLQLESSPAVNLDFAQTSLLRARVFFADDSTPAAGQIVRFAIQGVAGGAGLSSAEIHSGADGRIENLLTAGSDRSTFDVVISAHGADNLLVHIGTDGIYKGRLNVRFTYNGIVPITNITTEVHRTASCATATGTGSTPAEAQQIATATNALVSFDNLPEHVVYSVTATGLTATGILGAKGCVTAGPIVGRGQVNVTLPLERQDAIFIGNYDFATKMHLNQALPGAAGAIVEQLDDFFFDPGDYIASSLTSALSNQLGQSTGSVTNIMAAAWTFYALQNGLPLDSDHDGRMVDDAIRYFLLNQLPSWAIDGMHLSGDLTQLLTNFTAGGTFKITEDLGNGRYRGSYGWEDFLFSFRAGANCDFGDECCGRLRYSASEMDLQPIGAEFIATAVQRTSATRLEYDLTIPEHRLQIQYGNLVVFLIEHVLIPQITGQDGLPAAIEAMIGCTGSGASRACGCDRVGAWLDGIVPTGGLGSGVCDMALSGLQQTFENNMRSLSFNGTEMSYFASSISGVIADDDRDLRMDMLSATMTGNLVVKNNRSPFDGNFSGSLAATPCTANSACAGNQNCEVKLDVLNDCSGRQICAVRVGDRAAGERCTADSQCQSGTCISDTRRCLALCEINADCGSSMTCHQAAANVKINERASMVVNSCGF